MLEEVQHGPDFRPDPKMQEIGFELMQLRKRCDLTVQARDQTIKELQRAVRRASEAATASSSRATAAEYQLGQLRRGFKTQIETRDKYIAALEEQMKALREELEHMLTMGSMADNFVDQDMGSMRGERNMLVMALAAVAAQATGDDEGTQDESQEDTAALSLAGHTPLPRLVATWARLRFKASDASKFALAARDAARHAKSLNSDGGRAIAALLGQVRHLYLQRRQLRAQAQELSHQLREARQAAQQLASPVEYSPYGSDPSTAPRGAHSPCSPAQLWNSPYGSTAEDRMATANRTYNVKSPKVAARGRGPLSPTGTAPRAAANGGNRAPHSPDGFTRSCCRGAASSPGSPSSHVGSSYLDRGSTASSPSKGHLMSPTSLMGTPRSLTPQLEDLIDAPLAAPGGATAAIGGTPLSPLGGHGLAHLNDRGRTAASQTKHQLMSPGSLMGTPRSLTPQLEEEDQGSPTSSVAPPQPLSPLSPLGGVAGAGVLTGGHVDRGKTAASASRGNLMSTASLMGSPRCLTPEQLSTEDGDDADSIGVVDSPVMRVAALRSLRNSLGGALSNLGDPPLQQQQQLPELAVAIGSTGGGSGRNSGSAGGGSRRSSGNWTPGGGNSGGGGGRRSSAGVAASVDKLPGVAEDGKESELLPADADASSRHSVVAGSRLSSADASRRASTAVVGDGQDDGRSSGSARSNVAGSRRGSSSSHAAAAAAAAAVRLPSVSSSALGDRVGEDAQATGSTAPSRRSSAVVHLTDAAPSGCAADQTSPSAADEEPHGGGPVVVMDEEAEAVVSMLSGGDEAAYAAAAAAEGVVEGSTTDSNQGDPVVVAGEGEEVDSGVPDEPAAPASATSSSRRMSAEDFAASAGEASEGDTASINGSGRMAAGDGGQATAEEESSPLAGSSSIGVASGAGASEEAATGDSGPEALLQAGEGSAPVPSTEEKGAEVEVGAQDAANSGPDAVVQAVVEVAEAEAGGPDAAVPRGDGSTAADDEVAAMRL